MGLFSEIKKAAKGLESNIRRNTENVIGGVGAMVKGDFRNANRTLLDLASLSTAGFINPDDMKKVGQNLGMNEQATRTVTEQAQIDYDKTVADATAEAARLQKQETDRAIASTIAGQSTLLGAARRRSLLTVNQGRTLLG